MTSPTVKFARLICLLCFLLGSSATLRSENWTEFRGPDRAGVWTTAGIVENFEGLEDPLPRKWSAPVGAGYSGPTVSEDSVFLMDRGVPGSGEEVERVLCVDRATGALRWAHSYPCVYRDVGYAFGPRSSVTVGDGKAFALGMMGNLHCLDAATGEVIWARDLSKDYRVDMPIWGLTASPLLEDGSLIVQVSASGDGATFVGFSPETGKEKWKLFSDKGSYVSPIVVEQAGQRVTVLWSGQRIAGIDAASGKVHWEIPTPPAKMPINVPGPAVDESGSLLFLSVFYDGSRLIELGQDELTAKERWHRQGINERKTDALHSMISPPFFQDGKIYGIDSYGQMRCLDPETGDRIWEDLTAVPQGRWGTGFIVKQDGRIWMLTERGDLVIAKVSPEGYEEIDRARLIEATTPLKQRQEGTVLWSHPAFAGTEVFARNDRELICVDLAR